MANEAHHDNKVEVKATETHAAPHSSSTTPMSNEDYFALGSLVSLLGLCTWIVPYIGIFISGFLALAGVVLGILGRKSVKYKTVAIVGLVISSLMLVGMVCLLVLSLLGLASIAANPDLYNY